MVDPSRTVPTDRQRAAIRALVVVGVFPARLLL